MILREEPKQTTSGRNDTCSELIESGKAESPFQRSLSLNNLDGSGFFNPENFENLDDLSLASSSSSDSDDDDDDDHDVDTLWDNASNAENWTSKQQTQELLLKASGTSPEKTKKNTMSHTEQVQFDCFGFPLFDLQADSPPPPRASLKKEDTVTSGTAQACPLPDLSRTDKEKAARRARRRRTRNTIKNDSALPEGVVPPPPPLQPVRRRRSTGLLNSKSNAATQEHDASPFFDESSSKHVKSETRTRRRKSFGDGSGLLGLGNTGAEGGDGHGHGHGMSSSERFPARFTVNINLGMSSYSQRVGRTSARVNSPPSPKSLHHKSCKSSHSRRPRRSLSDGGLFDAAAAEYDEIMDHHVNAAAPATKRTRRRSGSRRRSMAAADSTAVKSHCKERRTSAGKQVSNSVKAEEPAPQNTCKGERRRPRRKDVSYMYPGAPKRFNRSMRNLTDETSSSLMLRQHTAGTAVRF